MGTPGGKGGSLPTRCTMEIKADFGAAIEKIVKESNIVIDRPKGSFHPKFHDFICKVDYGDLDNTASMDRAGIDI